MFNKLKIHIKKILKTKEKYDAKNEIDYFLKNGMIPWSKGYNEYKVECIKKNISDKNLLFSFNKKQISPNFGYRLDERVVEYPWIFSNLTTEKEKVLDAGSTFNFEFIVNHDLIKNKDLTIFTFAPEKNSFTKKRVSYVYGDLRELPFKDNWFDTVVSQSTIEHIDMDNSIYGYDLSHNLDIDKKSFEYLLAVKEMLRVLKGKGSLFLTFPYGKFENHGFFQQFDKEMLDKILEFLNSIGKYELTFFKYEKEGWCFSSQKELKDVVSYNPHTGKGKQDDNAAHCRSVVCINFTKSY